MSCALRALQMFPPLTVGASLVLAESRGHLDPSYIVNLLVEHKVTEFIFSVPTLVSDFREMTASPFFVV